MKLNELLSLRKKIIAISIATGMSFSLNGCNLETKKINNNAQEEYSNIELIELENNINQIIPTYNYESFYLTETDIKRIIEKSNSMKKCDYIYDGNLEYILKNIKNNSENYIENNSDYQSCYEIYKNENNIDFDAILNDILKIYISKATNNINEDMCNIKKLKIVIKNDIESTALAYYLKSENIVVINKQLIDKTSSLYMGRNYIDLLKDILLHEINHVREKSCECRDEKKDIEKVLEYEEGYISVFLEAAAESEIYNMEKYSEKNVSKNDFSYQRERKKESYLLLLGLCRDNINIEDYYNAIYDGNISNLYKFCGMTTDDEIYTLYKIIYSIDAANYENILGTFLQNNCIQNPSDFDVEYLVGYGYKVEVFKEVLKNMATYTIDNSDFTLEENIVLFDLVKNLITTDSYTVKRKEISESNNKIEYENIYDDKFVEDIYNLENAYVDFLSKYYNKSIYDIRNLEEDSSKVIINIDYISQNAEPAYYEYSDISYKITDKFPIIKAIVYPYIYYEHSYDYFIKENEHKLTKK